MTRIAVAALTFFLPASALAHDFWIEATPIRANPGSTVSVALKVGERLRGEPVPRIPPLIERFAFKSSRGETPVTGRPGADPAGTVRVTESGWIAYQSRPSSVSLDAQKFETYLREEGLERIIAARAKSGRAAAPGREQFHRCAKAFVDVDGGAATTPVGLTLELVPRRAPGANLPLTLLFRGKPLANALVVARSKAAPEKTVSARTDRQGQVTLKLAQRGFWLVKAVHMEAARPGGSVDWESWWASMTFDLRE